MAIRVEIFPEPDFQGTPLIITKAESVEKPREKFTQSEITGRTFYLIYPQDIDGEQYAIESTYVMNPIKIGSIDLQNEKPSLAYGYPFRLKPFDPQNVRQTFTFLPSGAIQSVANSLSMSVPLDSFADNTPLQHYPFDASSLQIWTFDSLTETFKLRDHPFYLSVSTTTPIMSSPQIVISNRTPIDQHKWIIKFCDITIPSIPSSRIDYRPEKDLYQQRERFTTTQANFFQHVNAQGDSTGWVGIGDYNFHPFFSKGYASRFANIGDFSKYVGKKFYIRCVENDKYALDTRGFQQNGYGDDNGGYFGIWPFDRNQVNQIWTVDMYGHLGPASNTRYIVGAPEGNHHQSYPKMVDRRSGNYDGHRWRFYNGTICHQNSSNYPALYVSEWRDGGRVRHTNTQSSFVPTALAEAFTSSEPLKESLFDATVVKNSSVSNNPVQQMKTLNSFFKNLGLKVANKNSTTKNQYTVATLDEARDAGLVNVTTNTSGIRVGNMTTNTNIIPDMSNLTNKTSYSASQDNSIGTLSKMSMSTSNDTNIRNITSLEIIKPTKWKIEECGYVGNGEAGYAANDDLSSVILRPFTDVYLYEHSNFSGRVIHFHNGTINDKTFNLTDYGFNDIASSYRIRNGLINNKSYADNIHEPDNRRDFKYKVHMAGNGWDNDWSPSGKVLGQKGNRMEAIMFEYSGPGQMYARAHVADYGWLEWVSSGMTCGTTGQSRRLEAVEFKIEDGNAYFGIDCFAQGTGWISNIGLNKVAGTTGQSRQLEQIRISVFDATIPILQIEEDERRERERIEAERKARIAAEEAERARIERERALGDFKKFVDIPVIIRLEKDPNLVIDRGNNVNSVIGIATKALCPIPTQQWVITEDGVIHPADDKNKALLIHVLNKGKDATTYTAFVVANAVPDMNSRTLNKGLKFTYKDGNIFIQDAPHMRFNVENGVHGEEISSEQTDARMKNPIDTKWIVEIADKSCSFTGYTTKVGSIRVHGRTNAELILANSEGKINPKRFKIHNGVVFRAGMDPVAVVVEIPNVPKEYGLDRLIGWKTSQGLSDDKRELKIEHDPQKEGFEIGPLKDDKAYIAIGIIVAILAIGIIMFFVFKKSKNESKVANNSMNDGIDPLVKSEMDVPIAY